MNENESTTNQNLRVAEEVVLRGKFIAVNAYIKKEERFQINNLTFHIKKQTGNNPKKPRRKE